LPCVNFMPHQREAIEKLHSGSILCAGVGTGKSITALGYFYMKVCGGVQWDVITAEDTIGPMLYPKPLYIITTARKRDTGEWARECERFDIYEKGSSTLLGTTKTECEVTIDSWNNIHKYEDVRDAFFVFDEQRVVGSGAWVKSFYRITRANEWILLSATPGDTWMDYIPVFVANRFYKNRTEFLRRHAVFNRFAKYPKVDRWIETGHLERLRRSITVTMEYEKKTVPHWNDIVVTYDKALYDKILKDRWNPWENEPIEDIARACYLMRRAVNESDLRARELFWLVVSRHRRAIVFYNYDYELELIKRTFREMIEDSRSEFERSNGGVSLLEEDHDIQIAEWNGHKHESIPKSPQWVYLVQYNAGAEGWNCVETDTLIFFSQSYSYKMMTQAAGRIDRLNTPFVDLYYYVFKTEAPIDLAIDRALRTKRNFNEKLFLKW